MRKNPLRKLTPEEKEMVEQNINLVYKIAHSFPHKIEFDDMVGEGMIALILAVQKYKPETGYTFSTYAYSFIRGKIQVFLSKNKVVKPKRVGTTYEQPTICEYDENALQFEQSLVDEMPDSIQDLLENVPKQEREIIQKYIEGYTKKEIAIMTGLPKEKIYKVFRKFISQQKEAMDN